jgi:hypothetical protein
MSHPSPLTTMGRLTFAVSSQGALDFVEELQVRESDWEVADRHGCVVWVATQCAMMIPVPRRHESDACRAGAWAQRDNFMADCAFKSSHITWFSGSSGCFFS